MRGAEPAGAQAQICAQPLGEHALELVGAVADHDHVSRLEPEVGELAREIGPVLVSATAAHELRARDDDYRARPRDHPVETTLTPFGPTATIAAPAGTSVCSPFTFSSRWLPAPYWSQTRLRTNRCVWPFSSVP